MKIQPIQPNVQITRSPQKESHKEQGKTDEKRVDTYTPAKEEKSIVYEKPAYKVDVDSIERLKAEADKNYQTLRQLIQQLLERQGVNIELALSGDATVEVDEETRTQAQEAISDGGPLSPENVSNRIVDFAIAISGGDKTKLALLKEAIDKGFQAAADALGGTLPDISYQTYELVMEKLDAWANEE